MDKLIKHCLINIKTAAESFTLFICEGTGWPYAGLILTKVQNSSLTVPQVTYRTVYKVYCFVHKEHWVKLNESFTYIMVMTHDNIKWQNVLGDIFFTICTIPQNTIVVSSDNLVVPKLQKVHT